MRSGGPWNVSAMGSLRLARVLGFISWDPALRAPGVVMLMIGSGTGIAEDLLRAFLSPQPTGLALVVGKLSTVWL